jgi:hypothetical protein
MKSIVPTLVTGDDYIDNVTWCHPSVTMTTRGQLSTSRDHFPHRPSPPVENLKICFEILKKNGFYLPHMEYEGSIGLVLRKMKKKLLILIF